MVNVQIVDVRTCCVECKMCVTVGSLVVTMYHLLWHKNTEIFHIVHMCVYSYDSCDKDRFIFLNSISRFHSVIKMVGVLSDIGT